VDGCFHLDPAELGPHITGATLVLDHDIYTLHHDTILIMVATHLAVGAINFVTGDHAVYRAADDLPFTAGLCGISTGNHLNCIALFYPFHLFFLR